MPVDQWPGDQALGWLSKAVGLIVSGAAAWAVVTRIPQWWRGRQERKRIQREQLQNDRQLSGKLSQVLELLVPAQGLNLLERVSGMELSLQRINSVVELNVENENWAAMYASPKGEIVKVTALLVKWLGRPPRDIIENGWLSFVDTDDRGRVMAEYSQAIAQERAQDFDFHFVLYDRTGRDVGPAQSFPVRMVMQPLDPPNIHGYFVRLFRKDQDTRGLITKIKADVDQLVEQNTKGHRDIEARTKRLEDLEVLRERRLVQIENLVKEKE